MSNTYAFTAQGCVRLKAQERGIKTKNKTTAVITGSNRVRSQGLLLDIVKATGRNPLVTHAQWTKPDPHPQAWIDSINQAPYHLWHESNVFCQPTANICKFMMKWGVVYQVWWDVLTDNCMCVTSIQCPAISTDQANSSLWCHKRLLYLRQ